MGNMTTIATCSNIAEAELLKGLLDQSGIPAFVPDEMTANSAPMFMSPAGIRLQVEDEDVAEARRVIATAETSPDDAEQD
jgi:putative signal transducing protein